MTLLRDQAEEQALDRVRLAGLSARDEIRRTSEDTLTSARLLASRPTLQRLVREGQSGAAPAVHAALLRDRRLRQLRGARRSVIIAQTGQALPWTSLAEMSASRASVSWRRRRRPSTACSERSRTYPT
jgi:hypothetical protein